MNASGSGRSEERVAGVPVAPAVRGERVAASPSGAASRGYRRYHIATEPAPDIAPYPSRFRVKVKKHRLALLLLEEAVRYRGDKAVILSRPCVYGVFSGPVGGFAPREHLCVGCLRCTTEHPRVVQIHRNPEYQRLGDSYFTPDHVDAVSYEARTGRVPVKGAGYRGPFGGEGWDGMWTDMSEIVRPTRDGIHGREFISTVVDIGEKPAYLVFDARGEPQGRSPGTFSIPIPFLLDVPPRSVLTRRLAAALAQAARQTETLALMPLGAVARFELHGPHVAPLVGAADADALRQLSLEPRMVALDGWDEELVRQVRAHLPRSVLCLRVPFAPDIGSALLRYAEAGVRVFHLVADFHGRGADGRFALEWIREVHGTFVEAGCRDAVTLLGSGGIVLAEHVAKAIICGLDAVALDTAALVALQARLSGECRDRSSSRFALPDFPVPWAVQRLTNLLNAWRDQLLEVLGAMGMREVRRLRGEMGRAMLQAELEREAFQGITGYDGA